MDRLGQCPLSVAILLSTVVHLGVVAMMSSSLEGVAVNQTGLMPLSVRLAVHQQPGSAFPVNAELGDAFTRLPSDGPSRADDAVTYQSESVTKTGMNAEAAAPLTPGKSTETSQVLSPGPRDGEYFEDGDLDQPAALVGEWYVLADLWPASVGRVELRIWIGPDGTVDHWNILAPAGNPDVQASLAHLNHSILNPARRHGQAVASVMTIELVMGE